MPIPASVIAQVSALDDAIVAAGDLNAAPFAAINGLAYQAGLLSDVIDGATGGLAGALDTFTAPLMPQDIVAAVLSIADSATTQMQMSDLGAFIARIEINLENR
jgi:hypothetical protein